MTEPVTLGSDPARSVAVAHIERRIAAAPKRLSHALAGVDLSHGVIDVLGDEVLSARVSSYSSGREFETGLGFSSEPAERLMRSAVERYLRQGKQRMIVMQSWDRPTDASILLSAVRATVVDGEVWTVIDDALLDERYLRRALGLWLDPFIGVAVMGQSTRSVWEPGAFPTIISDVLNHIDGILVGAFDGEGFLLWRTDQTWATSTER